MVHPNRCASLQGHIDLCVIYSDSYEIEVYITDALSARRYCISNGHRKLVGNNVMQQLSYGL